MPEHPILFSGPMVRAILNCQPGVWPAEPIDPTKPWKWQTRRIVRPRDPSWTYSTIDDGDDGVPWLWEAADTGDWHRATCTCGQPGDLLWVRETISR